MTAAKETLSPGEEESGNFEEEGVNQCLDEREDCK